MSGLRRGAIASVNDNPLPPSSALYGYFGAASGGSPASFSALVPGYPLTYVMTFGDGTSWASVAQIGATVGGEWQGSGYKLICPVNICPATTPSYNNPWFQPVSVGTYDYVWTQIATDLISRGFGNCVIRLAWEFNLGWPPWAANSSPGGGPPQTHFVPALQRIVTVMRAVPGAHFVFNSFNPSLGDQTVGDIALYYPGDAYCDLVGPDIYDTSNSPITQPAQWNNQLGETFGINYYLSFAATHSKGLIFPEWGLWPSGGTSPYGGGDDPYFITQMLELIAANNVLASFWNDNGSSITPPQYPNSLTAFRAQF